MILKHFTIIVFLYYLSCQIKQNNSEIITYVNTEHPQTYWYNKKCVNNFTWWNRRLTRKDPRHYLGFYYDVLIPLNDSIKIDFYFHQFLTNGYRPSFVEMHVRLCKLLSVDNFLSEPFRKALGGLSCPFPPGQYVLHNITFPFIPKGFPFSKGRLYIDIAVVMGSVTTFLGNGSIDFEIKTYKKIKN